MPAPFNTQSPEKKVLDANDRYLQSYFTRENNAYQYLINYTYPGGSAMVSHTWTAPSGNVFSFDVLGGIFLLDSVGFSSLSTSQKVIFFRYLQKFVGECIKNYNITYGL